MKRIILIVGVITLLNYTLIAQVKYDKYSMSYFQNKEYNIEISEKNKTLQEVYIAGQSLEYESQEVYLVVDVKKLNTFIDYLNAVKIKYSEWSNTAVENKIEDMSKEIPIINKDKYTALWKLNEYYADKSAKVQAKFIVNKENHSLMIFTGKLYSTQNSYINSDGFLLCFSNIDEIDSFIEKINPKTIQMFIESQSDKKSLFN